MIALAGPTIDGTIYPSVSRVLSNHPKREAARKSAALNPQRLSQKQAKERGTVIHAAIKNYLLTGQCDLPLDYMDYWDQVQQVLALLDPKPIWLDGPLSKEQAHFQQDDLACIWSKALRIQGCPDFLGLVGGVKSVIEWKTGTTLFNRNYDYRNFSSYWPWFKIKMAELQSAGYSFCAEECLNFKPEVSIVVNLTPTNHQVFIRDHSDFQKDRIQFKKLAAEFFKTSGANYTTQDNF